MHSERVDRPSESQAIRTRHFLDHGRLRDETSLSLPLVGVPPEFAALRNGSYTCVRGSRASRRRLLMLTIRDAMLLHRGISITAILPLENEHRWLGDLHATFSRRSAAPDAPPPGWAARWDLVQVTAGASADRIASALTGVIDLVVVDGLEALSVPARRAVAASSGFDHTADLHDPLVSLARRSDAVVIGGIDVSTDLPAPDRQAVWDDTIDLGADDRVTRSRGGTRRLSETPAGWRAHADDSPDAVDPQRAATS